MNSDRMVTLRVPAEPARGGSPHLLKDLLFDELLRRVESLERERDAQCRAEPGKAGIPALD